MPGSHTRQASDGNYPSIPGTKWQINRNEFGFCEECLEKDKEIETLKTLLLKKEEEIEKKEKEMRESCRELGKMEERLSQFEKVLAQKECTH